MSNKNRTTKLGSHDGEREPPTGAGASNELLHVEYRQITSLKPYARNARTHSRKQVKQIADSITTFGFANPVLLDQEGTILAGHGRVEAAKLLKMDRVPCVMLNTMTPQQKRAFVLADNKLALNARWDEDLLAEELKALIDVDVDLGFGAEITGFSIAEIDHLVEGLAPEEEGNPKDDALPPLEEGSRCNPGDVWQLGRHRLICGNALDVEVIAALMDGQIARMVFSDPPYNVEIQGHVGGSGKTKHREFAMASGEMTSTEFTDFLAASFRNLVRHSCGGSIHFICMDWRHMGEMLKAGGGVYSDLKNLIVWAKDNGGMGTFYRSRHELIFAFKNGDAPHINTFELGQHGRYRTNVWQYKGVNTLKAGRMDELALHPTVKPVQMIADAIKDCSGRGDIILDIFGGSGSTLIAAEKTGRRGFLCELDPIYCDRIIRRWEVYAKDEAIRIVEGTSTSSKFQEAAQ
ncbi:site-specific DNA-methyltransferase [Mesorhizobium qingshengii]|uniref:site-specific DNA-methyltransferase (adenine-specific) n=1 Tax=Mesorhizobium qingshengii TaxID=1165689 RepID=A0ABT4R3C0_9HYPH|nr:DNA methyltransferase [Mesorhizobium qingshengii]MCZ8548254.1 site-specific DNA-methyltransferase [Mesorhizobium qingshengii]